MGGAALVGDATLFPGRLSISLHVGGFTPLELEGRITRRQLVTRNGRCAVQFANVSPAAQRALLEIADAEQARTPPPEAHRAIVVGPADGGAARLASQLGSLGFSVRQEGSPGQAAAWLERERTEVIVVDESAVEMDRWSVLDFARKTAPEVRRFVVAADVRGFRLYYAIKAGLVEGLLEPGMAAGELGRRLMGASADDARATPRRSAR